MDGIYRFLVRGHLDDRWSAWLGELAIDRTEDGCSVLTGRLPDQAALHGVIARIRDLGLPLLAVESAGQEECGPRFQPIARGSPDGGEHSSDTRTTSHSPSNQLISNDGGTPCD
jgi:hypothetical protein